MLAHSHSILYFFKLQRPFALPLVIQTNSSFSFSYGVALATSDIRLSRSSDGEDSDITGQQTVRVKRTLPKDITEQNGPDNHQSQDEGKSKLVLAC